MPSPWSGRRQPDGARQAGDGAVHRRAGAEHGRRRERRRHRQERPGRPLRRQHLQLARTPTWRRSCATTAPSSRNWPRRRCPARRRMAITSSRPAPNCSARSSTKTKPTRSASRITAAARRCWSAPRRVCRLGRIMPSASSAARWNSWSINRAPTICWCGPSSKPGTSLNSARATRLIWASRSGG